MSGINLPRAQAPMVAPGGGMGVEWYRFLRDFAGHLGLLPSPTSFSELVYPLHNITGDTSIAKTDIAGDLTGRKFTEDEDDYCLTCFRLPNDYKDGTDLSPFFEWTPDGTDTGDGVFSFEYGVAGVGDAITSTIITKTTAGGGTAGVVQRTEFADVTGTDFRKGDLVLVRFGRIGTDSDDTLSDNTIGILVGLKYRTEGVGNVQAHP